MINKRIAKSLSQIQNREKEQVRARARAKVKAKTKKRLSLKARVRTVHAESMERESLWKYGQEQDEASP